MYLKDIYPSFVTENKKYECKQILNDDKPLGWLKTVVGFANASGGILFVGVNSKDFSLVGLDEKQVDKQKLYFYQNIKNHIQNNLDITTSTIEYSNNNRNLYILKIQILEAKNKPVILLYDNLPLIFVRRDGYTSPATYEEIRHMILNNIEVEFDTLPTDIKFNIDDFKQMNDFCYKNTGKNINVKHLSSFNFIDENNYLTKGGFLFSDKCQLDNTKIVCNQYKDNNRGGDFIISTSSYKGNLIGAYFFIEQFVYSRMNHSYIKKDNYRIDIDAYPKRALFEAIINSLAHRDYFLNGTEISVDLFPNRLCITSPGSLYGVGELKPTYKLSSFLSKRRNNVVCSTFVYLKAMEAKGTGFEKIEQDYSSFDIRHKPIIFSKNNQFSIILPDLTYKNGVDISQESIQLTKPILNESIHDFAILSFCYFTKKSVKDISSYLKVANSSYLRNTILKNLCSQGFLKESVEKNTKLYETNLDIVKLN